MTFKFFKEWFIDKQKIFAMITYIVEKT